MTKTENIRNRFQFDSEFKSSFDSALKLCDTLLTELSNLNASDLDEYGICVSDYSFRYISPEDVSTFISNIVKLGEPGCPFLFTASELSMFTVASIKRFNDEHGGVPFEHSAVHNRSYVNPRYTTVQDLMLLCNCDIHEKCVCSTMDIKHRIEDEKFSEDVDTLKKMHFPAVMRNIMNGIPDILMRSDLCADVDPLREKLLMLVISEFMMFAATLFAHTANEMLAYVKPVVSYKTMVSDSNTYTECCLLKTNSMNIRSKMPFDCNMRNVVLQDMHPYFADTRDALTFIMTDKRSPIMVLVNKYRTDKLSSICCGYDITGILRMSDIKYPSGLGTVLGDKTDRCNFHTDLDWLHGITFGNNYMNGNYRRDANGNNHVNPITASLEMLYRMFSCDKLKTNEELADNIVRIANYMMNIIQCHLSSQIENHELVRDILCTLGECMTRSMLRLYDNNTHVLRYDVNMDDTEVPGCTYMEAFVLEADENTENPNNQPKPQVTSPNAQQKEKTTTQNIKEKLSDLIRRFTNWVREKLSQFPAKWLRDHAMEVKWINGNKETNEAIGNALDNGTFSCTINNWPGFNIPGKEIVSRAKMNEIVKSYLDKEEELPDNIANEIKKAVYPLVDGVTIEQVVGDEEEAHLTNLILYSKLNAPGKQIDAVKLDKKKWEEIIKDLTATGNLLQTEVKAVVNDLKQTMTELDRASRETKQVNGENEKTPKAQRAEALFKVVQEISQKYTTLLQNVIARKFYATEYNMYRDIIKLYKQQVRDNNGKTEPPAQNKTENENQQEVKNNG